MVSYVKYDGTPNGKLKIKQSLARGEYIKGDHEDVKGDQFLIVDDFVLDEWLNIEVRPLIRATLDVTDILMLDDHKSLLSQGQFNDLKNYRQQLRDYTNNFIGIQEPTFVDVPSVPESIRVEFDKHKDKYQFQLDMYMAFDRKCRR